MQLFGAFTLMPPLVAIILAFITKEVIFSLFIGIFSGTFLLSLSSNFFEKELPIFSDYMNLLVQSFSKITHFVLGSMADSGNAGILLQVLCIGGVVALVSKMGGFIAIAKGLSRLVKGPASAQVNTWLVGLCIFFDDYANSLTVGPIMRPITDKFKISREKLSFILDSTAAPVAGIAVISTWIGFEVSLIKNAYELAGVENVNAYSIFLQTIPYRFYNIFMLLFVVLTALMGREFGPMLAAELRARRGEKSLGATDKEGQLEPELTPDEGVEPKISDALVPILTLIIFAFIGFYFNGLSATEGADLDKIMANPLSFDAFSITFGNADSSVVLFQAALFATVIGLFWGVTRGKITLKDGIESWLHGWKSMIFTACILLLAWSLTAIVKELGTPKYIIGLLAEGTPQVLLPSVIFLFGSMISFAIGTAFGTMGILMPLAIPLAFAVGKNYGLEADALHQYMVINIASVLTGSIFGNSCSPIGDCVILSAISAKCTLTAHVQTQLPYSMFICAISVLFGYLPAAFNLNVFYIIVTGILAMIVSLRFIGKKVEV